MRVLFLSPRQSLPARSGAKLREYHFLRALGRSAKVSYIYFQDAGSAPLTVSDLPFCAEVVGIPKPRAYTLPKIAMGILGHWPLPILNYTSAEMNDAVCRSMDSHDFDLIHLDSIHMIRYALAAVERKPSLRAIYNWHNVESEAMTRYSATGPSPLKRLYAGYTASRMARLESEILHSAFGHIVCSERERGQLLEIAPKARVSVVENGVDTGYFAGAGGEMGRAHQIIFVGAMDYYPNSDGAIHFANEVWPRIRSKLAGVELVIVGANPGPAVLALGNLPGVKVTGMVPDVRPYYGNALAAVVPLRTGGGTRLKILEAMAAGVPVVSTPLGAEGLEVNDGENIVLVAADDADGWADRLSKLAESSEKRSQLSAAGLALVRDKYDWEILGAKLRGIYQDWALPGTSSRV